MAPTSATFPTRSTALPPALPSGTTDEGGLSVVIVSFRSGEVLRGCLASLAGCRHSIPLQVVVVDNASGDGTVEMVAQTYPWVELIENPENVGFTRAVNQGVAHARAARLLLLNPDCIVSVEALERLLATLDAEPGLAAAAPALLDAEGNVARSCGCFPDLWALICDHFRLVYVLPHSPLFARYLYGGRAMESLSRVDWASGAALLIPRPVWEEVGGLDENIFMYLEEVDWCRRAARIGRTVRYVPAARIVHLGQQSSRHVVVESYVHNLRSRIYYFDKHHGWLPGLAARMILALSLIMKWVAALAFCRGRKNARMYAAGLAALGRPDGAGGRGRYPVIETDPGPRRVLYIVNSLALGGAERVLLDVTSRLDRSSFAPEVASLEILPQGQLTRRFAEAGITVHALRQAHEPLITVWPRLNALIARRRPHIVHTHLAASGVIGRIAARRRRVPAIISTLHSLSDWQENRWHPLRCLDRYTVPAADLILPVSDAIRNAFLRLCPQLEARTLTMRNGVPLARFEGTAASRPEARAALGYAEGDFVVGSVARLNPEKGLDTLVEAAALAARDLPELRLLVVGEGPERRRLIARALSLGFESHLHLAGHHDDVRRYLAAMDVFAAPSRSEGLGVAIIEALAAGLPVIAARVGGIPEVIEDGVCGRLLAGPEPAVWAETLVDLATHRESLAGLAAGGPLQARRFAIEDQVAALERAYDQVLGEVLGQRQAFRCAA